MVPTANIMGRKIEETSSAFDVSSMDEHVRDVHFDAFVVDGHADTIGRLVEGHRSLGDRSEEGHTDLPRLKEGGVDLQFFAFWPGGTFKPIALRHTLSLLDAFNRELEENEANIMLIKSYGDIESAKSTGRLGALLSLEGGEALEGERGILRMLFSLGFRSMSLTHNERNELGDGVRETRPGGLTEFGVRVIEEMNRLGMVLDLAHLSEKGFFEALEISKKPPIVSHACCSAICQNIRNLSDEQIRALAKRNGLVGIAFVPKFLTTHASSIDDVVEHITHVVRVAGIDHVGLGSDYDGTFDLPMGLEDVSHLPRITEVLFARGFSEEDVRKILGGNYLRILKKTLPE